MNNQLHGRPPGPAAEGGLHLRNWMLVACTRSSSICTCPKHSAALRTCGSGLLQCASAPLEWHAPARRLACCKPAAEAEGGRAAFCSLSTHCAPQHSCVTGPGPGASCQSCCGPPAGCARNSRASALARARQQPCQPAASASATGTRQPVSPVCLAAAGQRRRRHLQQWEQQRASFCPPPSPQGLAASTGWRWQAT
jgi:hypothetical protein